MSPPAEESMASPETKPRALVWLGWAVVLSLLAYFVRKYALHYFVFTPESYGTYFWPRFSWVVPHVASSLLAILIGPLQFWPRMRRDYLQAHRIAGRVYVGTVLNGSIAAVGLAIKGETGPAYALGLIGLALAWFHDDRHGRRGHPPEKSGAAQAMDGAQLRGHLRLCHLPARRRCHARRGHSER